MRSQGIGARLMCAAVTVVAPACTTLKGDTTYDESSDRLEIGLITGSHPVASSSARGGLGLLIGFGLARSERTIPIQMYADLKLRFGGTSDGEDQFVIATPTVGFNLFPWGNFGFAAEVGAGPIGQTGDRPDLGFVSIGTGSLVFRLFGDPRNHFKFFVSATTSTFMVSPNHSLFDDLGWTAEFGMSYEAPF